MCFVQAVQGERQPDNRQDTLQSPHSSGGPDPVLVTPQGEQQPPVPGSQCGAPPALGHTVGESVLVSG